MTVLVNLLVKGQTRLSVAYVFQTLLTQTTVLSIILLYFHQS